MRRPVAALLGTVAGTVLLVGAKFGTAPPAQNTGGVPGAPDAASDGAVPADPSAAASGGPSGGTGMQTGSAQPSASAAPVPGKSATAAPTRTTGGSTATTAAPACTKVTGNSVNVSQPGIGAVTVTITVCNQAITVSSGSQSRSNWDPNTQAVPALNQLAVKYYKTNFSAIHYSGASLTSAAYRSSLRSAMTRAGI